MILDLNDDGAMAALDKIAVVAMAKYKAQQRKQTSGKRTGESESGNYNTIFLQILRFISRKV